MNKQDMRKLILNGDFDEIDINNFMTLRNKEDFVFNLGFEDENLSIYAFLCYLIKNHESGELHDLASSLMFMCFNYYKGGYTIALYHAKRAHSLEPTLDRKQVLLSFYEIPEQLISQDYARKLVQDILESDPNNKEVREFIKNNKDLF